MISSAAFLTILGMAVVTYLTRVLGFMLLRGRQLRPRTRAVMDVAPGCVMVSVIAPHFVSSQPEELIALAVTILAASRLAMLPTVAIGVASLAALQVIAGA